MHFPENSFTIHPWPEKSVENKSFPRKQTSYNSIMQFTPWTCILSVSVLTALVGVSQMPTDTPTGTEEMPDKAFRWGPALWYCWVQLWKPSCYPLSEGAGSFHFWVAISLSPSLPTPSGEGSCSPKQIETSLVCVMTGISTTGLYPSLSHTEIYFFLQRSGLRGYSCKQGNDIIITTNYLWKQSFMLSQNLHIPKQLQPVRPISLSRWTHQHYHHCRVGIGVMVGQVADIIFMRELDAEGECVVEFSSHTFSCSCTAAVVVSGRRERERK